MGGQSIVRNLTLTILVISTLFIFEFIGLYLASRDSLSGLTELHKTIQMTAEVRQVRQLLEVEQDFQRDFKKKPLMDEEQKALQITQDKTDQMIAELAVAGISHTEMRKLLLDIQKILPLLRANTAALLSGGRAQDVKTTELVIAQYHLELQDALEKLQLMLTAESDRIFQRVYTTRFMPLTVGVMLSLGFFCFVLWMGISLKRQVERPIVHLIEVTRTLSGGNLSARARVYADDEIGQLAHAFNNMAEKIEESTVSKTYVESILESMMNCVLVLNDEGLIVKANRLSLTTFGYTPQEMVGLPANKILRYALPPGEHNFSQETVGMNKTGGTFPVMVTMAPLVEQTGHSSGLRVCVVKDITENKKFENEIRDRNLALSVANQELEAFSYSVSHDLRAPLRAIDGFSQALLEDAGPELNEENRNHLDRIRFGVQRMGHLIDAVINLNRLSRSELNKTEINLSALAHSVAEDLQRSEPERQVEFVIQEGLIDEADGVLMKITMENLLGNAWKYTAKKPFARIEFGATEENGRRIYFVRDNGAGFDMAYAKKLFSPFQRLHNQSDFSGTGVGLASVKRVIQKHGGDIRGEGCVDEGATFFFTLSSA